MSRRAPLNVNRVYVDQSNIYGLNRNGQKINPFVAIQDALDFVADRLDASASNPYFVVIAPGLYQESLVVRSPFTSIIANGARGSVIISSPDTTRAAVLVTDATLASIDAFYAAGGKSQANVDAQFGLLVHDPALVFPNGITFPAGFEIHGCRLTSNTVNAANNLCLLYINTQNAVDTVATTRLVEACTLVEGLYWRNSWTSNILYCDVGGLFMVRNARPILAKFCTLSRSGSLQHNAAQPIPVGITSAQLTVVECEMSLTFSCLAGGTCSYVGFDSDHGSFQMSSSGSAQLFGCVLNGDLILENNAVLTMLGGAIGDDVIVQNPGVLSLTLNGVHIQDDINLNAGGTKTVVMNGGAYMGTLTDPDAVFVRNLGS